MLPLCLIHCNCAVSYSVLAPMVILRNFLTEQNDILGESNWPKRNNKVTSIFFMSAQWNYIIAENFSLRRLFVSGEYLFCNWLNLYLQGIEIVYHPSWLWRYLPVPRASCGNLFNAAFIHCLSFPYLPGRNVSWHENPTARLLAILIIASLLILIPKASPVKLHSFLFALQ